MAHPVPLGDGYAADKFNGNYYAPHAATLSTIPFKGKTTHAAASPWEGINALDAIVLRYNAVSMLRQQINPTSRIHGLSPMVGCDQIIPDHSRVQYCVRAVKCQLAAFSTDNTLVCAFLDHYDSR
jgi:metal-dependent amidase/aminoacylase/carboxypeptidase family protein